MNTLVAIDIVLLPSDAITKLSITLNQALTGEKNSRIQLNTSHTLPHISLCMGVLDLEVLPELQSKINPLLTTLTLSCEITTLSKGANDVFSLVLKKSTAIQDLHEKIMSISQPYLSYSVDKYMIHGEPHLITESSLNWIASYATQSSFENFDPHITIGFGDTLPHTLSFPITFETDQLALYQLGPHCTCQKQLVSW